MEIYKSFASVYDLFMEDTEYDSWIEYLHKIWEKEGIRPELILDLGCGTGNITHRLAEKGYEMIGVDISEEMLMIAKKKAEESGLNILYLLQDMRDFELYGTVDVIVCLCDGMNYITDPDDMAAVFRQANNYLNPGGLFIFDLNTEYKFKYILADHTFAHTEEDAAYIWENFYDESEKMNEYYMNFFIKEKNGEKYHRFEECHYEKSYSVEEIKTLIEKSGMEFVSAYDAFTFHPPSQTSQRIYMIAKEKGK